jgi:hypothetical protein
MSELKIKYLAHPVSTEEKSKWREKGFKIIDKQFEPEKKQALKQEAEENEPT